MEHGQSVIHLCDQLSVDGLREGIIEHVLLQHAIVVAGFGHKDIGLHLGIQGCAHTVFIGLPGIPEGIEHFLAVIPVLQRAVLAVARLSQLHLFAIRQGGGWPRD